MSEQPEIIEVEIVEEPEAQPEQPVPEASVEDADAGADSPSEAVVDEGPLKISRRTYLATQALMEGVPATKVSKVVDQMCADNPEINMDESHTVAQWIESEVPKVDFSEYVDTEDL